MRREPPILRPSLSSHLLLIFASVVLATTLVGCDEGVPTPEQAFEKSCNGEAVLSCRPHEYAIVREASVMPDAVEVGDVLARLEVHVRYDRCAEAGGPHVVSIRALATSSIIADGGATGSLLFLDEVRDNGTAGDTTAEDGLIDVTVDNFFFTPVPPSTDLTLRFEPSLGACTGGSFEVPYRTGPMWTP